MHFGIRKQNPVCRISPLLGTLLLVALQLPVVSMGAPPVQKSDAPRNIFDDEAFPQKSTTRPAPRHADPAPAPATHPGVQPPAPGDQPPSPVAGAAPAKGDGVGPGLIAESYAGPEFRKLMEMRVVHRARATFDTGRSGEAQFSIQWRGFLNVPVGGMNVAFQVVVQGQADVSIDGQIVGGVERGQTLHLGEGAHPIKVRVFHIRGLGRQSVGLYWVPQGEEIQGVPSTVFTHDRKDEPGPNGLPEAAPGVARGTLPAPVDPQLATLRNAIKQQFANQYAQANPVARQALVNNLIAAAGAAAEPAERFALWIEAEEVAAAIGNVKTALECIDAIARVFQVDETELRIATLTAVAKGPGRDTALHELRAAATALADRASEMEDYDAALRAALLAEAAWMPSNSADALRAKASVRDLRELAAQYAPVAASMKVLSQHLDDPDAALKAGRFYCFDAGRWDKGIPLLARSNDLVLKALAEAEAARPLDVDSRLKLGDSWWDKGAGEAGRAAARCKERAAFWYDQARASRKEEVPDRILQRLGTFDRTIDLMPLVEVDETLGAWKKKGNELVWTGDYTRAALELPYRPAGDFDFIVEFTIWDKWGGVAQIMPVRGTSFDWRLDTGFINFEPIKRPRRTPPVFKNVKLGITSGNHYTSVVQFRRTGARAAVNGNGIICDWRTDYTDVGPDPGNQPPGFDFVDPRCIGLSCTGSHVVIHAIKIVEVPRGQR